MLGGEAALLDGCERGVADRAVGVEVLSDPAEGVRAVRAQQAIVLLHGGGLGGKELRPAHVDQLGAEMQHQRGLDVAGMDAVGDIERRVEAGRQAEARPMGGDDQHSEPHPQLTGDDADHLGIAAMGADDNELAQASAMHGLADLCPDADEVLRRNADGARRAQVLVRFPDRLHRQDQRPEVGGQARQHGREHAFADRGVGHHGQVRAVLLDRRHRQHRNRGMGIELRELARLELRPETLRHDDSLLVVTPRGRVGTTLRTFMPGRKTSACAFAHPTSAHPASPFPRCYSNRATGAPARVAGGLCG